MSYLAITLNHFRAVKAWGDACDAQINLDIRTFNLEIKSRNRYYTLRPRFLTASKGKIAYAIELLKEVKGFIGWLPYDVLQWDLSKDKLLFKKFLEKAGLKFPLAWLSLNDVAGDFLIKDAVGSFGYQIAGPYRRGAGVRWPQGGEHQKREQGVEFAEQFVSGTNLKVWFWGAEAFYAHVHPYPTIVGDGRSTVQALIEARLAGAGESYSGTADQENLTASLVFQGARLSDVLEQGQEIWMDFRYGRRYATMSPTAQTDNDLSKINQQVRQQIDLIGVKMAEELVRRFKAPVLYAVDGVVDEGGTVWWLEVNSNPILPPEGYAIVFKSLFGASGKS
ncbi:hypothetical protein [Polaromonas sp.]|uniref:hypothetical protein n=1 Tax=Polaromonas sp. TaxID=1869339 RepID=UPI003265E498